MPTYDHAQTNFTGGEISPRLKGRVDSELYKKALDYCLNFEPLAQGCGRMRGGSKLIASLLGAPRLIPLRLRSGQDFIVALSDGHIQVFSEYGQQQIYTSGGGNPNPDLAPAVQDQSGWNVGPFFAPGRGSYYLGAATRTYAIVVPDTALYELTWTITDTDASWQSSIQVGSAPGLADLLANQLRQGAIEGAVNGATVSFQVPGLVAGQTVYVQVFGSVNGMRLTSTFTFKELGAIGAVAMPWTVDQLAALQYASDSASNTLVLVHPNVAPQVLTLAANGYLQFGAAVFNTAPAEWAGTNWPSVVEIFQSRLFLGATPQSPNTLWASRSGSYFDFRPQTGAGGTVLASDGLILPVATKGILTWARGRRMLLVGTDLGEYAITSSTGTLTPSDLQVLPQSNFGAAAQQPEDIGEQVAYVSRDRRKIRAMSYAFSDQAWLSHDVTFIAEHITKDRIQELHYARDPNLTMVVPLSSGSLACCTYDRLEQIAAWWRFTTQGTIHSAAVSNGSQGSVLWLAVSRATGVYLEIVSMSEVGRVYVDAAVTLAVPAGDAPIVAGLNHLEGQQVRIILDGALEEDQVVQGGQVQLARAGQQVVIGLAYPDARMRLLPPEGGNPRGSSQRARRQVNQITLRLNESAFPNLTGQDGKPYRVAPDRSVSTPLDTPEPLYSGDVTTQGPRGSLNRGVIEISQDLPFRTEVLAVFESISVEAL